MPEPYLPTTRMWRCRLHGEINTTYQITLRNAEGEIVFVHNYCLQCYDTFLQRHLDILPEVKEDQQEVLQWFP